MGATFAADLLAKEFAPATRVSEIPEARWIEFVTRVGDITAGGGSKPPAKEEDLI